MFCMVISALSLTYDWNEIISGFIKFTNVRRLALNNVYRYFSQERGSRTSVSESNVLLDPEVLPDLSTQALVLTVLATLVKYSTDEMETRFLYQYLAEGSVVFPKVFPVMCVCRWQFSLLLLASFD